MSRQDDPAYIRREGMLHGVDPEKYLEMSAIIRQSQKSTWLRNTRQAAVEKGEDVEVATRQALAQIKSTLEAEFGAEEPAQQTLPASGFAAPEPTSAPMPRGLFGGSPAGIPGPPARRGDAGPNTSDLIGDTNRPRTLADIYARWPVGKEEHFYIRVERLQPKTFQNIACSGYIGDISIELSEKDFGNYFGGKDYSLTVYGPDPRGRKDDNGEPIVKSLADPVKLSVPILPPNLFATSISKEDLMPQPGNVQHPFNPFGMMQGQPPTAAEAQIQGKAMDTMGTMLKMERENRDRDVARASQQSEGVLRIVSESAKSHTEILRQQAERESKMLQDQLDRKEAELQSLKKAVADKTEAGGTDTVELIRALSPDKDKNIERIEQQYRQQIDTLRASNTAAIDSLKTNFDASERMMRTNHEAELRRADERLKDAQSDASKTLERLRQEYESRERALKDDLQSVRRELREDADKRLTEQKDRFTDQIHTMEKSHERELRNIKENGDTRLHVTDKTGQMQLQNLQERLAESQQELVRLRDELESAKDPVAVMQKSEALAEALGYSKPDASAAQGPWSGLATALGTGIGQAIGGIGEWGPQMLDRFQQARAAGHAAPSQLPPGVQVPQLPPGHPGNQQVPQLPQQRPVRRQQTQLWATEAGGTPLPPSPTNNPQLGFVQETPAPAVTPGTQQVIQAAPMQAAPMQPTSGPVPTSAPTPDAAQNAQIEADLEANLPPLPPDIAQSFRKIEVIGFAQYIEQQIKANMEPSTFLDMFHGASPEHAQKAAHISKDSFLAYMRSIPGNDESPIMSRAGLKWIDRLWLAFQKKYG